MATRRFGVNPGYSVESVVEGVGSATAANNIELTVDLASTIVSDNGTTRTVSKTEVLLALELLKEKITNDQWPPA